jgi:DNA repair protein RadC
MDYDYMPINCSIIGIGNDDKIIIDIGEIFKIALLCNARHIIIAHNHLGSSLKPTESDLQTTQKIGYVGNILGIPLIDSIIVNSSKEYTSIRKYIMDKENPSALGKGI